MTVYSKNPSLSIATNFLSVHDLRRLCWAVVQLVSGSGYYSCPSPTPSPLGCYVKLLSRIMQTLLCCVSSPRLSSLSALFLRAASCEALVSIPLILLYHIVVSVTIRAASGRTVKTPFYCNCSE